MARERAEARIDVLAGWTNVLAHGTESELAAIADVGMPAAGDRPLDRWRQAQTYRAGELLAVASGPALGSLQREILIPFEMRSVEGVSTAASDPSRWVHEVLELLGRFARSESRTGSRTAQINRQAGPNM